EPDSIRIGGHCHGLASSQRIYWSDKDIEEFVTRPEFPRDSLGQPNSRPTDVAHPVLVVRGGFTNRATRSHELRRNGGPRTWNRRSGPVVGSPLEGMQK